MREGPHICMLERNRMKKPDYVVYLHDYTKESYGNILKDQKRIRSYLNYI